ncbi:MAG TPA: Glu-tRNA(Gln) amidotransferase GatDE subunit E, partial [candidate division Zixibacteria bacterium]|nr:Glu-tRNA(Gln) amidotransferase GatDE subunit E [candidate division Zixibacteria bacterium]
MSKKFEIIAYEDATPQFYKEIGFKAGLEVHQQLDTEKKLFCRCPAGVYSEDHDAAIIRHMRPTLSEMGTYDGTALMEFKKQKEVLYLLKDESVCTYEMDDTPPFLINEQALEYAIKIAQMFGCEIVGEVHIMRKQYLDGSIPTGFQRTAIIGLDGEIPLSDGRVVRVRQLNLEEDACREVSDIGHRITFRTDRLSMPLIEVITDSSIDSPQMAYEVARRIQALTRASGLVRRGIGASRQDVNGSVAGGSRVEIKGVPRIPMIPKLLHYEAVRQKIFL